MVSISRFSDLQIIKDSNNIQRFETFPNITPEDIRDDENDVILRIQDGQRIDALAHSFLGDGRYWWIICLANGINFPLGNEMKPGTLLRIPTNANRVLSMIRDKAKSIR
mgnify:CR=1 FL=1